MSVIRSYNLSNGQAINDAPAQIIRIFDSGVLIVNADSGAVTSVNGKTGIVVLAASDVGAATAAQGALADTAVQPGSLGTAAAAATSDFDPAGAAAAAQSASQPVDSDLTAIAALATTGYGRTLLTLADQGALMALLAGASDLAPGVVELATTTEASTGTDTTRAVTPAGLKASVDAAVAALINSAPGTLDTLGEIAAQLASDESAVSALTTTVAGKLAKASNLSDLPDASIARTNLGLGSAATQASSAFQPADSDLTAIAALTTTDYGRDLLALANQAALMALLSSASTTAQGIVELATSTETITGTDTVRAVTPAGLAAALAKQSEVLVFALGDESTAITTGTKVTFRMPFAMTLTAVRASLTTASSSGNPAFDVKESGTSIFSTALTIDSGEKTSTTAATPAVISDANLADDAEVTLIVSTAGTGATGAKITFIGTRA